MANLTDVLNFRSNLTGANIKSLYETEPNAFVDSDKSKIDSLYYIPTPTITANYAAADKDEVRCDSSGGTFTISLPASGSVKIVDIVGVDADTGFGETNKYVTLVPQPGGTTILGETSLDLDVGASRLVFTLYGSDWKLIDVSAPQFVLTDWSEITNKPTYVDSTTIDFTETETEITGEIRDDSLTASKLHPDVRSVLGLSAYAIAVANGFVGTEQEWVDSLNGKSIYELAVQEGFDGSLTDYLYQYLRLSLNAAFVTTWNTENLSTGSSATQQVKLPLQSNGTYDFIVDWGDGSNDTITTWNQAETTHTYATPGVYTVSIVGQCWGWRFNNTGDRLKLILVHQWGNGFRLGNNNGYFYGCSNCQWLTNDILDTTGTTNMSNAFRNCTSLDTIPGMGAWNVSNVTDMSNMFQNCTNFNQPLDSWNVSSVTNMGVMFSGCTNFNQPLDNWNVSNVTNMSSMFSNCINFNQPLDNWNVSKVQLFSLNTYYFGMFYGCINFNQPLNSWNVSAATQMLGMFFNCTNFNQPLDNWNVSNVTNMQYMFHSCTNFNQPLNSWNMSSVTNIANMFNSCTNFNQPLDSWNVSSVTSMVNMLSGANAWSDQYYDDVLLAWSQLTLQPNVSVHFGDAKYTESAARGVLTSAPNNWTITDGGAA